MFVRRESFRWIEGEGLMTRYVPDPPYRHVRSFCSRCGASLGEAGTDAESFPIAADTLDVDLGVRIRFRKFVSELPPWEVIGDDARRFDRHPERG